MRTFISPFDPVILADALKRERARGGQSFYVVPRIADLDEVAEFLREVVPELKVARAHGQLTPTELEDIMTAFYEGQYDILLSTAIVESGLDVPNANTLIVHRADMFGLAALYQLRGRVGRSKRRAYAYFTTPPNRVLTEGADKRLKVLQSLDTLGAGFSLASHDLDIRGAGNLLGEEQSGHIREVGFELYQSMLEEAVAAMKGGDLGEAADKWSPEIALGMPVLIPEAYVADLQLRLGLYRRLSSLETRADIDGFAAELVDRFGRTPRRSPLPARRHGDQGPLPRSQHRQGRCRPQGCGRHLPQERLSQRGRLAQFLQAERARAKMQPDHKLVFRGDYDTAADRIKGVRQLVASLARIAGEAKKAA